MRPKFHAIYDIIFKFWRRKRLELFNEFIKPQTSDVLLDLGGHPHNWTAQPQKVARIDCLNIHKLNDLRDKFPAHNFRTVIGDACKLDYADGEYDIVFSNSVIEHLGDWQKQQDFASEAVRVGKKIWIQTPAYECPIEPHFLAPFVHWLPLKIKKIYIKWLSPWAWMQKPSEQEIDEIIAELRLLHKSEMHALFPNCEIITERLFFIFPKSYIAVLK